MYKKRRKRNIYSLPGGFRMLPNWKLRLTKNLFKSLEKQKTLTESQRWVVEEHLNELNETIAPDYIARVVDLLEKPVIKAKVDAVGNPVSNKAAGELESKPETQ